MVVMSTPTVILRSGGKMPLIAFGTGTAWHKNNEDRPSWDNDLFRMTAFVLEAGFRHIDCSERHGNLQEISTAIKNSGIPRNELFITLKVEDNRGNIPAAIHRNLQALQMDYVDLYLIYNTAHLQTDEDYQAIWKTMEDVKKSGKAKAIGVCNFKRKDIEAILRGPTTNPPAVNQLEYHPHCQRENDGVPYIPWLQSQNIQVMAFKAVTTLSRDPSGPLMKPLRAAALEHNCSETAVLLRWFMQELVAVVTTTQKTTRLVEWREALEIRLTQEEMDEISRVGKTIFRRYREEADQDDHS